MKHYKDYIYCDMTQEKLQGIRIQKRNHGFVGKTVFKGTETRSTC